MQQSRCFEGKRGAQLGLCEVDGPVVVVDLVSGCFVASVRRRAHVLFHELNCRAWALALRLTDSFSQQRALLLRVSVFQGEGLRENAPTRSSPRLPPSDLLRWQSPEVEVRSELLIDGWPRPWSCGGRGCCVRRTWVTLVAVRGAPATTLDAFRYGYMMAAMARAATTSDVFNAIAEPQRREILVLLRAGERPVTELAQELGMSQPGASKHLRVLREVGLVRDRKAGKQRLYDLDARGLRAVHEWAGGFERFWNESFDRLDAYVQDLKQAREKE
jgi:DNA-binding transcriptional ArsR family regulator